MELASLTWKEAEEIFKEIDTVILPVGSLENHGTHGPLGTDFMVPDKLAKMVSEKVGVLVLPTMPYGVCPHHMSFPGTINIGHDALIAVVRNISFSLLEQGIKRFIFLNGHGGNSPALESVALDIYNNEGIAAVVDWWSLAGQLNSKWAGGHGGGQEASAMLAIKPEWVKLDEAMPRQYNNLSDTLVGSSLNTIMFKDANIKVMRDVRDVVESGWYGPDDPKDADIEDGKKMLETTADYIVEFIKEFKKVKL